MSIMDFCVDREKETNDIMREIYDANYTTIKFLYSTTAVGKSTFTNKIQNEINTEIFVPICVRTVPENEGNKYKEWDVFLLLWEKVNQLSYNPNNNLISFKTYCSQENILMEESVKKQIADTIKCPSNAVKSIAAPGLKLFFKTNQYNTIIWDESLKGMKVKKNYLKYIFSNFRILLVIDNMQNIDNMSLKNILDIIHETKWRNHFALLEYTLTKTSTRVSLDKLIKYVKNYDIVTYKLKVNQIPREYIIDVVTHALQATANSYEFSKSILNYYDNQIDGNLWQIISYAENCLKDISSPSNGQSSEDEILKKYYYLLKTVFS